jgi:phospholipid/cholesterol/gamma-HCH transport system substrate-binding protein
VKRAIKNHRVDFAAIFVLVLAAIAVTGYILEHQPAFNFGRSYYTVKADFAEASAVTSGQGQAVTIAGVPVGQVGSVTLQDGHAVVQMNIEKKYAPIYRNATVLLRPRTPLKDMYLELDPGTRSAGKVPDGGSLSTANTNPDVDVSEILSSLDSDSRNYLVLLLSAAAGVFRSPGQNSGSAPSAQAVASLQETLKRFGPLDKDTKTFASLLAKRQSALKSSVHNLDLVAGALGGVDNQLASLIKASDTSFRAIANNDTELGSTLQQFPGTLKVTTRTLGKVRTFASATGTALHKLQPFAKNLGPALKAARPLFKDTTPVVQNELRPFSVALQPLAHELRPAAADLKATAPKLASSVGVLNSLVNELAYQGKGESRSYLFYGGWLAHIADSLVSNQDANGAVLQGLFMGDCSQLNFFETQLQINNQPLGVILDLLNAPPIASIPGAKPLPAVPGVATSYSCPD